MATTSRTSLPKPIKLKVCSVNEEYEIDDTEELLKEAYEEYINLYDNSDYKPEMAATAKKWLKENT